MKTIIVFILALVVNVASHIFISGFYDRVNLSATNLSDPAFIAYLFASYLGWSFMPLAAALLFSLALLLAKSQWSHFWRNFSWAWLLVSLVITFFVTFGKMYKI